MSEQFNIQQPIFEDWLKDSSHMSQKQDYTFSQISKSHFFDDFLEDRQQLKSNNLKQKNRINSKNYRERKKNQQQNYKKYIDKLQVENNQLKNSKVCRYCKVKLAPQILFMEQSPDKHQFVYNCKDYIKGNKKQTYKQSKYLQFQKVDLLEHDKRLKKAKIWIALGLLMLVIGISIYGLDGGKKQIEQILVYKQQKKRWQDQLKRKDEEYVDINLRIKQGKSVNKFQSKNDIKIVMKDQIVDQNQQEEKISINKNLMFGIHAQLEDIGAYL